MLFEKIANYGLLYKGIVCFTLIERRMIMQIAVTPKLSWRLKELPAATGLTVAFWRKVIREGKIKAQEVEGAIMDDVLREFLTRKPKERAPNRAERIANSVPASAEAT